MLESDPSAEEHAPFPDYRPGNLKRLLAVLTTLDAVFRMQPERRLRPTEGHLFGSGHLNLLTNAGPLDLLATIGRNLSYEDLVPYCLEMDIGDGCAYKFSIFEMLITLKEELGGEKDFAVLPILRQTLRELRKTTGLS